MLTQVRTVTVCVSDQDKALAFYTEKLGFEKRRDDPMGPESSWIEVAPGGAQTALVLYKATEAMPGAGSLEEARARVGTFTGLVLGVDDIRATFDQLRASGVPIVQEPEHQPWGWQAIFADEDGNSFVVVQ